MTLQPHTVPPAGTDIPAAAPLQAGRSYRIPNDGQVWLILETTGYPAVTISRLYRVDVNVAIVGPRTVIGPFDPGVYGTPVLLNVLAGPVSAVILRLAPIVVTAAGAPEFRGVVDDDIQAALLAHASESNAHHTPGGGGGLPMGSAVRTSLRWDSTAAEWEAFSVVDIWYYALTISANLPPIAAALLDALGSGFAEHLRGSRQTTYIEAAGVVLGRWNRPYYKISGQNSWESDGAGGNALAQAAFTQFSVDDMYAWILLPVDTASGVAAGTFVVVPIDGSVLDQPSDYVPVRDAGGALRELRIDGVSYFAYRASLHWEAGSPSRNFSIEYSPREEMPTVAWIT